MWSHQCSRAVTSRHAFRLTQLIITWESPKTERDGIPIYATNDKRVHKASSSALVLVLMLQPIFTWKKCEAPIRRTIPAPPKFFVDTPSKKPVGYILTVVGPISLLVTTASTNRYDSGKEIVFCGRQCQPMAQYLQRHRDCGISRYTNYRKKVDRVAGV